jgi:hydrogenase maturation protease
VKSGDTDKTLILGVGSPLRGDDALGIRAVEQLRARADLPPGVAVVDGGTEGIGLIPLLEAYRRVILVDAVPMGLSAGTIRRFTWQDVCLAGHERALSLHQTDLNDMLLLAEALGCLPDELVILGVQPHNMEWDQPVSKAVERALPVLVDALVAEVRSYHDGS